MLAGQHPPEDGRREQAGARSRLRRTCRSSTATATCCSRACARSQNKVAARRRSSVPAPAAASCRHSTGLDGRGEDVVAFATSKVPGWVTLIDRPRSTVFAAAYRALVLELASMAAGVLLILLTLVFVVRRSRRESETQNERARSWSGLTRALGVGRDPGRGRRRVALLAGDRVQGCRRGRLASSTRDGAQVKAESPLRQARRLVQSTSTLEKIAPLGKDGPDSRPIERDPELRDVYVFSGRRLQAIHSLPIPGPDGQAAGTISLVSAERAPRAERVGPARLVRRPGGARARARTPLRARARARGPPAAQPAARPAAERRRASSSPATTWRAATPSRSAATGTTRSAGPTGSSSSASATSAARASAPRR